MDLVRYVFAVSRVIRLVVTLLRPHRLAICLLLCGNLFGQSLRAESVVAGVIGDFGVDALGRGAFEGAVAEAMKRWAPDFIFTVGDNNYPDGSAATIDQNIGQYFHEYIGNYKGTYGTGSVSNRFFPALGNHDWVNNGAPSHDYFSLPGNERYYSYRKGLLEVFIINSNPDPDGTSSTSVQARWLQNALAASTARWKIVSLHHPPYSSDVGGAGNPTFRWPYAAWGASAVLAGHDHFYARIHTNGIPYFINGLGGAAIENYPTAQSAAQFRFRGDNAAMRVEATESNLVFHLITRNQVVADTFTVGAPIWSPFIFAPPLSKQGFPGQNVSFNVLATGSNLRYQWKSNGLDLARATNSSLLLTNIGKSHEASYSVLVTSGASSILTAPAQLSVLLHPLITQHPQPATVRERMSASLSVTATGAPPISYEWFLNGNAVSNAYASTLTITNAQIQHDGDYTVRVSDRNGAITSQVARLKVLVRPLLVIQPVSVSAVPGETVVFSVATTGTLPMNYGWRFNGVVMSNMMLHAHTSFWTIRNVQPTNAGRYAIGITNEAGVPFNGLSSNAFLTILADFDGDGLPDSWETQYGFDTNNAADGAWDFDADTLSNRQEYLAGTDPTSSENVFRVENIIIDAEGRRQIMFGAVSNKTYSVHFRRPDTAWQVLADIPAVPTNRTVVVVDEAPGGSSSRFYRLSTPR